MNEDFQINLVNLLKLFKNRPYHLAKYLSENSAFSNDFVNKIVKSEKLNKIKESSEDISLIYLKDISEMNDYYSSFLENMLDLHINKTTEEVEIEFNDRINFLISSEKFEEAARLRDYMTIHKIKRIKN